MGRFLCHDVLFDADAGLQGNDLFTYCGNNSVNRVDTSGADSVDLDDATEDILNAMTFESGGRVYASTTAGNGTGSMIGDIAYISNKGISTWGFFSSIWDVLFRDYSSNSGQSSSSNHTSGTQSPKKVSNPGGSYTQ